MKVKDLMGMLEKENVRFVRAVFVDVLGRMLDYTVPVEEFEEFVKRGKGFDGSSVEGFARAEESDLRFVPDVGTLRILPWEYTGSEFTWKECVVFGKIVDSKGNLYPADTRSVLKDTIEKHADKGKLKCGAELEFFLFDDAETPRHTDFGGYFRGGRYGEVRKEAQLFLKMMGIETEFDHHEAAHSQHEIDLRYADAVEMADAIVLAKYVVKRLARENYVYASFMPKPVEGMNGNGMHVHLSVWKGGKNLFSSGGRQLSDFAKSYLAGLLKYGREIQLGLNQWVNSYKRLCPGFEAPTHLVWGYHNRSAYLRVPEYPPDNPKAARVELRSPDPACNPYLAFALIHAAGMKGVEEGLNPPPHEERDVFHFSEDERNEIVELCGNLGEAVEEFERSQLVKETLPPHLRRKLLENKRKEWRDFCAAVTDYETKKYYPEL